MQRGTRGAGDRSREQRVSRTRCPRSARALPSPPAPPLLELFGLKASWGNGARSAAARPCPLREGIPLVSGMAACPSPHAPQPAASTTRHRPFQIRSLLFIYFFFKSTLFSFLHIYFRVFFFLSLSPLSWAGKAPQPGLAVRDPYSSPAAVASARQERGRSRGSGTGRAGDNQGSPSTAAFDRFSVVSFVNHHPNRDPPTPTPTVHPRKLFCLSPNIPERLRWSVAVSRRS